MLLDADAARKSLNEALLTDINFLNFVESVNVLIVNAIKHKKNYVRFEKHINNTYNEEILKILKSKKYAIHSDIEYTYAYDPLYECEMPFEKEFYVVYF